MIRIIGIQRSHDPAQEFLLLQNQGSLRINIKGHLILSQDALETSDLSTYAHVFNDEALIPPGMYVLLHSGSGESRWARSKDGALIYYAYMNRSAPIWDRCATPLHVLNTQHSYVERGPALMLR